MNYPAYHLRQCGHGNPAKDIYTLNYEVRAEGFAAFQETKQIEINWSSHK